MDLPKLKTASQREIGDQARKVLVSAARRQSDAKVDPIASRASTSEQIGRVSKANTHISHSETIAQPSSSTNAHSNQSSHRVRTGSVPAKNSGKQSDTSLLPVVSFAVIGNNSVGKSTFIRNALDLRRAPTTAISTSKVALSGTLYLLRLIETPRSLVNFIDDEIVWPGLDETAENNSIDGAICLYDVTNKRSLEGLPELLAALDATNIATCLAPCKVEIPLCDHTISTTYPDVVKSKFPSILSEETSWTSPDSAKRCLLKVLKQYITVAETKERAHPLRTIYPPRNSSRNPSETSLGSQGGSRQHSVYSRSRENLLKQTGAVVESESEDNTNHSGLSDMTQSTVLGRPHTPDSVSTGREGSHVSNHNQNGSRKFVPSTPESLSGATLAWRGSTDTADSSSQQTFLNMDDESIHESSGHRASERGSMQKASDDGEVVPEGLTFGELVDRLLATPTTKTDQKYVPAFLCLYRAFASPIDLLANIMDRFVRTEKTDVVAFTKTAEALRYLSILGTWTTYYPGDFAESKVRETAISFVTTVGETKSYAYAARQVANNLRSIVVDEDQDWAFGSSGANGARNATGSQRLGSTATTSSDGRSLARKARDDSDDGSESDEDDVPTPSSPRHSATASSTSSFMKPSQISSQTADNLHNLETARAHARRICTIPHILAGKVQWRQFMGYNVEDIAIEITRIDWTMYTAIRPRDFIRWVLLPARQRTRPGQADYIGMMTRQFNHLALFVSGMVLLRDKPKHRAQMIEKLMDLAWEVRRKNNYHALGAIVAGLSRESIIRLTQTQELVSAERHKKFLRLKVLMSHQRSHAAYRMAWENTSRERIPYVPRIQEDLTKAEAGNPTFIQDNLIKWSKFEVMGETIINVQRSQELPYELPDRTAKGSEIAKLILETQMIEDDKCDDADHEMHERSKQLEPTGSAGKNTKFDWLRYR